MKKEISALKMINSFIAACAILLVTVNVVQAGSSTSNNFFTSKTTTEYKLSNWQMYSSEDKEKLNFPVQAPTTVMAGLVANNFFDFDLFQSENLRRVNNSMFSVPWIFETSARLNEADWMFCTSTLNSCSVRLIFDGINYKADLTVNNVMIANQSQFIGALRRFEFDVTSLIDLTSSNNNNNNIINISASIHRPGGADRTFWRNPSIDLSIDFLDWNPSPPDLSMGLWRPVRLLVVRKVPALIRLDGFVVNTKVSTSSRMVPTSQQQQQQQQQFLIARLNVSFTIHNVDRFQKIEADSITISVNLGKINLRKNYINTDVIVEKKLPFSLEPNEEKRIWFPWNFFPQLVLTENPPLWYPFQMNNQHQQQPLFNATVRVNNQDVETWRYGIRSAESRFTRGGAFQLYINNAPILIRGGGYAPDFLMRIEEARTIKELAMIRSMGLNAIRLEGMFMSTEFYDMCDELGIIAMPGIQCCDGWQNWTAWGELEYHIANESIRTQSRRLAWHPSVAIFLQSSDDLPPFDVEVMYTETMLHEAWPSAWMTSAEGWYSNYSGSTGTKMSGCYSWVAPTYWLKDPNPHDFNNGRNFGQAFGFITENSPGASPMTLASWNRTVGGNTSELWDAVLGPNAPVISFHCGSPVGHFANLTRFNAALVPRYGYSPTAESFFYRAQVSNKESIKAMFEGYSRMKHVNATGVIQWMINKGWTTHLWTLYDFYHVAHGGFFGAKDGCGTRPSGLHVMMSPVDGTVALLNSWFIDFFDVEIIVTAQIISLVPSSSSSSKTLAVWERNQTVYSIPSDGMIPLDLLTVPCNNEEAVKIAAGGNPNGTYFVRLSWTVVENDESTTTATTTASYLRTNSDVNWYWMSPKMDQEDFSNLNNILFYYTPYKHYANMTLLNTLPAVFSSSSSNEFLKVSVVPIDTTIYSTSSFTDLGARYFFEKGIASIDTQGVILKFDFTYSSSAPGVAFFIQIRIVDKKLGDGVFDFTPAFFEDNFISLMPGESRTVICELPTLENDLTTLMSERIQIEIQTYNDVVAQNEREPGSGKNLLIQQLTSTIPLVIPPRPLMPPVPSRQSDNNNNNNEADDVVSKKEYLAAVVGAAVATVFALIASVCAAKFRIDAKKQQHQEIITGDNTQYRQHHDE